MRKPIAVAIGTALVIAASVGVANASTTNSSSTQITLTTEVVSSTAPAPFPTDVTETAACPQGTAVTGGGFAAGTAGGTAVGESYPDGNGWTAVMTGGPSGAVLTVYAVCASLG